MGIYIKGMEMPKYCDACSFACWSNLHQTGSCDLLDGKQCFDDYSTDYRTKRSEHCPLIEVPEPHGRLGDLDELKTAFPCGESIRTESVRATIDHMPTIIPASEEGET